MNTANQFKLSWRVNDNEHRQVLREFLRDKEISRLALTEIKYEGRICVNGEEVNVRYIVNEGDEVEVHFPVEKPSELLISEDIPLEIVYEDDYLLVINKQAGLNSIPSRLQPTGSIANALMYHYEKTGHVAAPHIVTRLDKETSGLMLIAKNSHVHNLFSKSQNGKQVKRQYEALVHGEILESGEVNAPIGRKDSSIIEREVREDGKQALTLFNRESYHQDKDLSRVRLELMTGRTHQIRVHMSYLGHPLIGDNLYGGSTDLINRQALHCYQISFKHPITKDELLFKIELADDLKGIIT